MKAPRFPNRPDQSPDYFAAGAHSVTAYKSRLAGDTDQTGLIVMAADYAWVGLRKRGDNLVLVQATGIGADAGGIEKDVATLPFAASTIYLRVKVSGEYGYSDVDWFRVAAN